MWWFGDSSYLYAFNYLFIRTYNFLSFGIYIYIYIYIYTIYYILYHISIFLFHRLLYLSPVGLVGNHIDIRTGKWMYNLDTGIGPNQDSFFEYLLKGHILFGDDEYLKMFDDLYRSIGAFMKQGHWYVDVQMQTGAVTLPWFTALGAFWPGLQVLYGDIAAAQLTMLHFQEIWQRFGFVPEAFNILDGKVVAGLDAYFLRPEMAESVMYLAGATQDPIWLQFGREYVDSIQAVAWTPCGYAIVKNVTTHELGDRMESFFLSETLKYLYLLFDSDNFVHQGNFIFTTEAHIFPVSAWTRLKDFPGKAGNSAVGNFPVKEDTSMISQEMGTMGSCRTEISCTDDILAYQIYGEVGKAGVVMDGRGENTGENDDIHEDAIDADDDDDDERNIGDEKVGDFGEEIDMEYDIKEHVDDGEEGDPYADNDYYEESVYYDRVVVPPVEESKPLVNRVRPYDAFEVYK